MHSPYKSGNQTLYSLKQVAEIVGKTPGAVQKDRERGRLQAIKGRNRHIRVTATQLEAYLRTFKEEYFEADQISPNQVGAGASNRTACAQVLPFQQAKDRRDAHAQSHHSL